MPVLLKTNEATELCITNNAETYVVGWNSSIHPSNPTCKVLQILFVLLKSPTHNVQLPKWPKNIIALTMNIEHIKYTLKSDVQLSISHSQITVLPDFTITDYNTQAKTCDFNIVDLCLYRGHQSVYTVLSWSTSFDWILILFLFTLDKITGGASDDLHRELKKLEILDDIMRT